jgi:hypothetical protein
MKEKVIGKIIAGLLICLMFGLVFGGLIDATSATSEKTTISITESSSLPDLIVEDICVYPDPPYTRGGVRVFTKIKNRGNADVIGSFSIKLYFDGTYTGQYNEIDGLPAGASKSVDNPYCKGMMIVGVILWPVDTNPQVVKCVIDPGNTIPESNDDNNERSESFSAIYNQPPILSNGYVDPPSGDTSTVFNYYVTYKDPDGDAPYFFYFVGIEPSLYSDTSMTKISGDYKTGAVFKYSTTLPALPAGESYAYLFCFEDGGSHSAWLPPSGRYNGPTVTAITHDMAVTDVKTSPDSPNVGQATTIYVTVKNKGNQQEKNVPVKAYVDGSQVGSTQVTLSADKSTTKSFTWTPSTAKTYSVKGEIGVVSGETDTSDNKKTISVSVQQPNQPPTCAIELRQQGTTTSINEIGVGEFFDIHVGGSTDDQDIKEVRFSRDDSQDGNPTGTWTGWYDWDTTSEDWNAISKTKAWLFTTEGSKEVWAEVKDGDGQTDKDSANINARANKPPTANAHGPYSANINEPIQFYGSGTDLDGDVIIAYAWDFDNDGITDNMLRNPTHSWSSAGTYYPTLKVQDGKTVWSELDQCTVNIGLADQTTDRSQLSDSIINQYKNKFPNDPEKVNEKLMEYTNSEREERLLNAILISTETEEQRNDIQTLIDSNTGDRNALLAAISAYINVDIEDHQSFWDQVKNKFWSTKIPKDVHEIAEAINIFDDLIKKVSWLKPIAWGGRTISTIEDVQAQHEITQKLDSSSVPTDTANALKVASAITKMFEPFDKTNYYAPVTDATIGMVVDVAAKITAQKVSVRNTEEFKYIYNDQRILFGEGKSYVDDKAGAAPIYLGSEDDRYYIKLQGKLMTDFISKLFGRREVGYWREIREVGDNKWELVPIPESSAVKSLSAFDLNEVGIKIYGIFTEDLDGDGYANIINYDTDNDTIPDVILIDKNNDILIDIWKFKDNESFLIAYDTNNNGIPDVYDLNDDRLIDAFDTDYNGVLDSFVEYNQTLIAWINAPSYGSIFSQNETIVFNGSVYNGTKNGTTPYSFSWVSDIFGFIGTGSLINSSTLPIGDHDITLMVQDSARLTDKDTIKITVYPPAVHHNIDSGKNFSSIQAAIDDPDTLDGPIITTDPGNYVEFENVSS